MKRAVIIVSRDRPELLSRSLDCWEPQDLPVFVMTEMSQRRDYRGAVGERAQIVPLVYSDRGVGYARRSAIRFAATKGLDSFVMADDDTVPTAKADVNLLLDFVETGRAVNCGGWLSIHNLWYRHVPKGNWVVPHFGDKLFAINVPLAMKIGFDPIPWETDTTEWYRCTVRAGYLWWIHSGVPIKELVPTGSEGGIEGHHRSQGKTRESLREEAVDHAYAKWGPRYVNPPGRQYRTGIKELVRDFVGLEALATLDGHAAYRDDDPGIPHQPEPLPVPEEEQLSLIGGSRYGWYLS